MSMNDQKIPALKVLSAVAVCEKYKDWILSHRTSWAASKEGEIRLDWKGNCQKPCDPNTEPYNFHCGFCRLENLTAQNIQINTLVSQQRPWHFHMNELFTTIPIAILELTYWLWGIIEICSLNKPVRVEVVPQPLLTQFGIICWWMK